VAKKAFINKLAVMLPASRLVHTILHVLNNQQTPDNMLFNGTGKLKLNCLENKCFTGVQRSIVLTAI